MKIKAVSTSIMILAILAAVAILDGCGGKTYRGKYITVSVPYNPLDEFEYGDWVVLSFESPGKRPEEGEMYNFWLFRDGKKERKIWLSAKIVGKRMFFLQERRGDNIVSHASFTAPPTYEATKERLKVLLGSEKPN